MEQLGALFNGELVQRVGWTLVHLLWQGLLAAIIVAAGLRSMRKAKPGIRYRIACFGLIAMVMLGFFTFYSIEIKTTSPTSAKPGQVMFSSDTVQSSQDHFQAADPVHSSVQTPDSRPKTHFREMVSGRIEQFIPWISAVWFFGVCLLSFWYLGGWCQLQRLCRIGTKPVTEPLISATSQLAGRLGINKAVHIVESALVQVPTVIGWMKPVIMLPASALTGLNEVQLRAMIAHELAHIKRYDYLINIVQTVIEILGFYHPAVWWMSWHIRIERENCCDDMAIELLQNKRDYACALFSMEEIRTKQLNLAVAANGGLLTERISRIAGGPARRHQKTGWGPMVVTLGLIVALVSGIAYTEQVADGPEEKILRFASDYCIGEIYLQAEHPSPMLFSPANDMESWTLFCLAQGDVVIPAGKRVKLCVFSDAWKQPERLEPLKQLQPDDLDSLVISPLWSPGAGPRDSCIPYISHLTGLRVLDLNDAAITQRGLKQLLGMEHLERFYTPKNLTNGGLATLGRLRSLKSILIGQSVISDRALSSLSQLPMLEELYLNSSNLTDEGLSYLPTLTSLNYLYLGADLEFTPKGYAYLAQIPNLRTMWINTLHCTDDKIRELAQSPTLKAISFHWESNITDQGLYYLGQMPGLKHIDLGNAQMTNRGLGYLGQIRGLESLVLSHTKYGDEGIAHLAGLVNLTSLLAGGNSQSALTDQSLKVFAGLTNLQELNTGGKGFTDAGLLELEKLPHLKILGIAAAPNVTDTGLGNVANLDQLESLFWSAESNISFAGLNQLVKLKQLKKMEFIGVVPGSTALELSGLDNLEDVRLTLPITFDTARQRTAYTESFSDGDLYGFRNLKKLKRLGLCGNGVSNRALAYLTGLDDLKTLHLYGQSQISDEGLKYLADLDQLRQLHIHDGNFTDQALAALVPMDQLEEIELTSNTPFSGSAEKEFKARKSNLTHLKLNINGSGARIVQGIAVGGPSGDNLPGGMGGTSEGMIGGMGGGMMAVSSAESSNAVVSIITDPNTSYRHQITYPRNWDEIAKKRGGTIQVLPQNTDPNQPITRIYDVSDLVAPPPNVRLGQPHQTQEIVEQQSAELQKTIIQSIAQDSWFDKGGDGRINIYGENKLLIWQTPEIHSKIETFLTILRQERGKQIAIEARFLLIDEYLPEDVGIDDSVQITGKVIEGPANSKEIIEALNKESPISALIPIQTSQTLNNSKRESLLKAVSRRQSSKTLSAPKAMVLNGESACMQVHKDLSYTDFTQEERKAQTGIKLDVLPKALNEDTEVLLRGHILFSEVLGNQIQMHEGKEYEIPYMQLASIPIHTQIKNQETVFIVGPQLQVRPDNDYFNEETVRMFIMIKPTIIQQQQQERPVPTGSMMGGGYGIAPIPLED